MTCRLLCWCLLNGGTLDKSCCSARIDKGGTASAPAAGRSLAYKDLMKMMVKGEKVEVLKYLRSMPSDESSCMRKKLLRGLELMQKKGGGGISSGSESSDHEGKRAHRPNRDSSEVRYLFIYNCFTSTSSSLGPIEPHGIELFSKLDADWLLSFKTLPLQFLDISPLSCHLATLSCHSFYIPFYSTCYVLLYYLLYIARILTITWQCTSF